jgi:hypothetical protein
MFLDCIWITVLGSCWCLNCSVFERPNNRHSTYNERNWGTKHVMRVSALRSDVRELQFVLVDISKVPKHVMSLGQAICYTTIKPEQTVRCSITVLVQTVYWLHYGRICVSLTLSVLFTAHCIITVCALLPCCWHDADKRHCTCWCSNGVARIPVFLAECQCYLQVTFINRPVLKYT